jgi:hypothetical protein
MHYVLQVMLNYSYENLRLLATNHFYSQINVCLTKKHIFKLPLKGACLFKINIFDVVKYNQIVSN